MHDSWNNNHKLLLVLTFPKYGLLFCAAPSKQKLELKSSKTRLLPSRSGVLIKFQRGVFTGNSRAISGLNSSFHQVDICVISGWYLGDIWMIFGWYFVDMWVVKTGIQKVEFKLSFCTLISPSWWLGKNWDSKSRV